MDNLDGSENNAKVSDSAYSNSCSNSHSRRSRSSKSTRSGSHSSGSSGYGGKQSTSGSSTTLNKIPEKRTKEKEGKKKQAQTELVQIQADVEFRLPQSEPAPVTEEKEEPHNAAPASPTTPQSQKGAQRSLEIVLDNAVEDEVPCNTPEPQMLIVNSKPTCPEGFSCVISMHDGVVLYMSSSLTTTLGFPKELWIGRSFIDFIHPLDHNMFASQITNGLAVPKTVNGMQEAAQSPVNSGSSMFCRIRRYRGLETGFSTKDRTVSFMPFVLRLSFKNIGDEKGLVVYLVIQASPLFSAFKLPNEIVVDAAPFVMRHAANGNLEYIDNEAVPFLGYMPQDVTGQDMLKMYHPEDLAYVRYIYEIIVKQGSVSRSKPYRLMTQNGHYLKLETEWSSFINPWSRKLEFVIGKHYVVEGPPNPDVFQVPSNNKLADEDYDIVDLKESIVRILQEVPTKPADLAKQQMTKRCQDLASFMESLIEEHPKPEEELRLEIQEADNSYYERDSVMLGGISPHHDYNDSKSSTGTPLSYNQLNFNINLKRYFDSHQESFVDDVLKNTDGNTSPGKRQYDFSGGCLSPMAFDSLETASVEFACPMFVEAGPILPYEYQPMKLTESLLNKHNAEMEKIFVKKHRETRPANKEEREKMNNETKQKKKDHLVRCNASFVPTVVNSSIAESQPHGVKRASKPDEPETIAHKQHCSSPRQLRQGHLSASAPAQPSVTVATVSTSTSMWPQNFVSGNPFISQQISVVSPITAMPGFAPMYYVPTAGPALPCSSEMSAPDAGNTSLPFQPPAGFAPMYYLPTPGPPMPCAPEMGASDACKNMTFQQPAMQYMMYGQAVFGSPIMVSPYPVQQNIMQNQYTNVQNNLTLTTRNYEEACKPGLPLKPPCKYQQAAWREEKRAAAVSPLSSVGKGRRVSSSICTATNALNRSAEAVPDSSHSNMKSEMDRTDGESSYSSFYSSFLKTESGSADDSGDTKKKDNRPLSFGAPHIPVKNNVRNKYVPRRKMEPPWMEQVCVTSELIYKYQVLTKNIDEVLLADKNKLEGVEQPALVNEQLGQLYLDMQLEGVASRLTLEEGLTSSGSSGEENNRRLGLNDLSKRVRRKRKYGKLVMIYEENAPLPPPDDDEPEPTPSTSVG